MPYKIITAYTPEYYDEVCELLKSMERFDLTLHEFPYRSEGSWERNTMRTVNIIRNALDVYPDSNIVWIDADARFFGNPVLFDTITADIGVHKRCNKDGQGYHYNSGTIFYANRPGVRRFLEEQIARLADYQEYSGAYPHTDWMLRNTDHGLTIHELPLEYSYIEGTEQEEEQIPFGRVVILHTQASRRMRRKIR